MPTRYSTVPAVEYTSPPVQNLYPTSSYPIDHGGGFGEVPQVLYSTNMEITELVQMFVVYAFIIAAALAAVFIFIGGISFISSTGNDEKIKQAVNTIRYSIVGLIVTILSFTFVAIIGKMFGLNLLDYLSYAQIKQSIDRLVESGKSPVSPFDSSSRSPFQPIR